MESSLDAEHSEGQFKVIRGHPRSNGLPLLYGHVTGGWSHSSLDANNSEGQSANILRALSRAQS